MSKEQQGGEQPGRTRSVQLWEEEERREIHSEPYCSPCSRPASAGDRQPEVAAARPPARFVPLQCTAWHVGSHRTPGAAAAGRPRCPGMAAPRPQGRSFGASPCAGGMAGPAGSTAPVINTGAASAAGAVGSGSGDSLGLLAARRAFHGGPPDSAGAPAPHAQEGGGAEGLAGGGALGEEDPDRPSEPTAIPTTESFPDSPAA